MTEEQESTRQKLFEAALKVFASKGYAQATVREICAEAGANVAAVNYHFGGKDALYAEVLRRVFSDASMDLSLLADQNVDPKKRLKQYVRNSYTACYDCKQCDPEAGMAMGAIYLMEMANPTPSLDEVVDNYIRPEAEILGSIMRGLLGQDAPDEIVTACAQFVVAQILSRITLRPIMTRLLPDFPPMAEDTEKAVSIVTRFSLGGIESIRRTYLETGVRESGHV